MDEDVTMTPWILLSFATSDYSVAVFSITQHTIIGVINGFIKGHQQRNNFLGICRQNYQDHYIWEQEKNVTFSIPWTP